MRSSLIQACFFLAFAAVARADVVHLTTGRTIKGTVVSEEGDWVVVKTPQGKVKLPRRLVRRIERQSKGQTQLALARQRAAQGAYDVAESLYEKAKQDASATIRRQAERELEDLRRRREASATDEERERGGDHPPPHPAPARRGKSPSTDKNLVLGGGRFARTPLARDVVLYLEQGRGREALDLLARAREEFAQDSSFVYLLGRAYEQIGRRRDATQTYLLLLKGTPAVKNMGVSWLREAARRRVAGVPPGVNHPGLGAPWKRVETEFFAVVHPFSKVEPWFARAPEEALTLVLDTLKIKRSELELSGRIQVLIFKDRQDYQTGGGMQLSGGHATLFYAPDGYLKTISAYPYRGFYRFTYRHEIAHTVLQELYPSMPTWAHEGAAVWVEPIAARGRYRLVYQGNKKAKTLASLVTFLGDVVPRGATKLEVRGYYAYASVLFETFVSLSRGPREALELCQQIGLVGSRQALKKAELSLAQIEAAADQLSRNTKRDR